MIRKYAEIFCWKNVSSFCSAKATHIFSAKNIRILYIESSKTVNEMTLNELLKLTTLWTTGPWRIEVWKFQQLYHDVQFEIEIERLHKVLPRARITLVETKKLLEMIKSSSSVLRVLSLSLAQMFFWWEILLWQWRVAWQREASMIQVYG